MKNHKENNRENVLVDEFSLVALESLERATEI
jgi:hypothetical protein